MTKKSELTGPSGVLKDADLISGNEDLKNSFEDGALDRDYLSEQSSRQRSGLSWCHCK